MLPSRLIRAQSSLQACVPALQSRRITGGVLCEGSEDKTARQSSSNRGTSLKKWSKQRGKTLGQNTTASTRVLRPLIRKFFAREHTPVRTARSASNPPPAPRPVSEVSQRGKYSSDRIYLSPNSTTTPPGDEHDSKAQDASLASNSRQNPSLKAHSATSSGKAQVEQSLSLFDELFPEEAAKSREGAQSSSQDTEEREARLPKEFEWAKSWPAAQVVKTPSRNGRTHLQGRYPPASPDVHTQKVNDETVVLILESASTTLTTTDFHRISPRGTHIRNWLSGITKVIPGRDPQTLEHLGYYYILFSSNAAARAYQDEVVRRHILANKHTPSAIDSPLAPPPGFIKDGEDLHAVIESFTLIPASRPSINIRRVKKPYPPATMRIISEGGVPALVARQKECQNLVLLHISNGSGYTYVSEVDVRRWLSVDAKRRGLSWGLINGANNVVRLAGREEGDEDEDALTLREKEHKAYRERRRLPPRFILSFEEADEAKRFVREWHRRHFTVDTRQAGEGEPPLMIDAELLW